MNTSSNAVDVGSNMPPFEPYIPPPHVQQTNAYSALANPICKPPNKRLKATILVADSDPTVLAQTIRILSREDFHIFSAVCHASAYSAAMKLELDVIVCDLSLWMGSPGQDLVAEIHALPGQSDVPIVFTASGQGPDIIRRQHDFGGAYHLKKPFAPEVLIEFVERALWMPSPVRSSIKKPHFADTQENVGDAGSTGIVIEAAEVAFQSIPMATGTPH